MNAGLGVAAVVAVVVAAVLIGAFGLRLSRTTSDFYVASGNNGMPGGRWDPQYQSVGVARWKDV